MELELNPAFEAAAREACARTGCALGFKRGDEYSDLYRAFVNA